MGTEQQQEFHSEKQTTKQRRKYIPFTDLSIKNWKPKTDKEKRGIIKMWNPVNFSDLHLTPKIMLL